MNTDITNPTTPVISCPLDATLSDENVAADHKATLEDADGRADHVDDAVDSPNAEAAKWRRKLRDTETELIAARERIIRYQHAEIERIAAAQLAVPADLFDIGKVTLPALLDDNDDPDPVKVHIAVEELLSTRPGLHKNARVQSVARHANYGQGQSGAVRGSGSNWSGLISG
ncbi:hypothetical protein DFR70_111234 [Nocardia tenerifensis]|uniref:Uncharacterized protein n=1 Tax=Nocardia tenerifensis TaxID=228006 RepID=A0A318JYP6_9NOCA|nr:hypothetical protein [Nocardia tenerifensis]PXX59847.1 hypothetical protein DFR70_111234 [Nocardia tenerifensis]